MFTLTAFEILLCEGKLLLEPAQQDNGSKRVSFQSLFYLQLMKYVVLFEF